MLKNQATNQYYREDDRFNVRYDNKTDYPQPNFQRNDLQRKEYGLNHGYSPNQYHPREFPSPYPSEYEFPTEYPNRYSDGYQQDRHQSIYWQEQSPQDHELPNAWKEMMIEEMPERMPESNPRCQKSVAKIIGKNVLMMALSTLVGMGLYYTTHVFLVPAFATEKQELVQSPIDHLKEDIIKVYQAKLDADARAKEEEARAKAEAEEQERLAQEEAQRAAEEQARLEEEQRQAQEAQTQQTETTPSSSSWNGSVLSPAAGVNQGPSGRETYYNLPMDGVVSIMRGMGNNDPYWVREDGVKMLGNYVMVAANLDVHPRGSLVESSLGTAIVCDTGGFAYSNPNQLDIATAW